MEYHHHHRVFCPRAGPSLQMQEPRLQFYQGLNRDGSFLLLPAPHSFFSIWTDLKKSEKIPGLPMWRWGEWIWVTGPSGLQWNSAQWLKNQFHLGFDEIRDLLIPITLRPLWNIMIEKKDENKINFQFALSRFLKLTSSIK